MNFCSRNREGYPDPTCNEALYNIMREERQAKRRVERKASGRSKERPPGKGSGRYRKKTVDGKPTERKELMDDDPGRTKEG